MTDLGPRRATLPGGPADVIVVGGGATGCATAYYASRAGARVLLLDRWDLNTEASGRNAGSLHGQVQREPFQERGDRWAREWLPALSFLQDSLALWDGLSDELGTDLEVVRRGGLLVADREDQLPDIERKVALENQAGVASRMIGADELRELAPWVCDRAVGGELCPVEGKANPLVTAPAFARRAIAMGASVVTNVRVTGIDRDGAGHAVVTDRGTFRAPRVVLAAGDGLPELGAGVGLSIPVTGEPIQVTVTEPVQPLVKHLVYYAGGRLTFKQAAAGSLLIGGGWPARRAPDGSWVLNPDSLRENLRVAISVAPAIADVSVIRTWVGIGDATPDLMPIIDEIPGRQGLFVGIYPHMGFTASPLMGRTLARLAVGGSPELDLAPFRLDRF
jgi:glycine/D-amino acid oxidase-like deaminating enzyme